MPTHDPWYRAARDPEKTGGGRAGVFRIATTSEHAAGASTARKPYEFGVKTSIVITHKNGLMVDAKTFLGNNPYDGHILHKQFTQILLENAGSTPKQVIFDFGFRGVDADNPDVNNIHRGKHKSLTKLQQRWLKRRQT